MRYETEPPMVPKQRREQIRPDPSRLKGWSLLRICVCVVGIMLAMAVLILAGISHRLGGHGAHLIEMNGFALFVGGLLIATVGMLLTATCGERWASAAAGIAIAVLFGMSFFPWYVEHGGKAGTTGTHRHQIWELGHEH
jgi:hypothetical protein